MMMKKKILMSTLMLKARSVAGGAMTTRDAAAQVSRVKETAIWAEK